MINIRRATLSDINTIISLSKMLNDYESKLDSTVKTDQKTKKHLEKFEREQIKRKDSRFFIALDGEKIVGYISGWLNKRNIAYKGKPDGFVCDCYVLEEYRKRGIGKKLIAELLEWFEEKNVEYIDVYTLIDNKISRKFWESLGFKRYMIRYLMKSRK